MPLIPLRIYFSTSDWGHKIIIQINEHSINDICSVFHQLQYLQNQKAVVLCKPYFTGEYLAPSDYSAGTAVVG